MLLVKKVWGATTYYKSKSHKGGYIQQNSDERELSTYNQERRGRNQETEIPGPPDRTETGICRIEHCTEES